MKIEIQVGNAILRVGEPSRSHLSIHSLDISYPPTFGIGEWMVMKATVDKMFQAAYDLENLPKLD